MSATLLERQKEGNRQEVDYYLGDSGKILLVLDVAGEPPSLNIKKDLLDPYMYLLDRSGTLPLSYHFNFGPLPYGGDFRSDVKIFQDIEYITGDPRVARLTDKGKSWLHSRLEMVKDKDALNALRKGIREELETLVQLDSNALFKKCYGLNE